MHLKRSILSLVAGALMAASPLAALAAQVGGYDVTNTSIQYDRVNNRTTYTYSVVGQGTGKDLSHFDVQLGSCFTAGSVVSASPSNFEVLTDPTTGIYGIK